VAGWKMLENPQTQWRFIAEKIISFSSKPRLISWFPESETINYDYPYDYPIYPYDCPMMIQFSHDYPLVN
jgi:hypothetical protein